MSKKQTISDGLENIFNISVDELLGELTYQIEAAYESTIDEFYKDYSPNNGDPWYYDRTYSTYLASDGYDNLFSYETHPDVYVAGINVSPDNIYGKPYAYPADYVFGRTFEKGIHGINRNDVIKMNKERTKDNRINIKRVPTNMNPSPKKIMDKKFRNIQKNEYITKLFNRILQNNLDKLK